MKNKEEQNSRNIALASKKSTEGRKKAERARRHADREGQQWSTSQDVWALPLTHSCDDLFQP